MVQERRSNVKVTVEREVEEEWLRGTLTSPGRSDENQAGYEMEVDRKAKSTLALLLAHRRLIWSKADRT